MGLTRAEAERCGIGHLFPKPGGKSAHLPASPPPPSSAPDDGMNKTERAYSWHLEDLRHDGSIRRWDFEPEKLRLAGRTGYTPDFRVVLVSGAIEWHEVKGGFMRDDAAVKLKVASELHPCYVFRLVRKVKGKGGGWEYQRVGRGGFGPVESWNPRVADEAGSSLAPVRYERGEGRATVIEMEDLEMGEEAR